MVYLWPFFFYSRKLGYKGRRRKGRGGRRRRRRGKKKKKKRRRWRNEGGRRRWWKREAAIEEKLDEDFQVVNWSGQWNTCDISLWTFMTAPYWVRHSQCHGLWQVRGNLQPPALKQQNVQATLHLPGQFPLLLGLYQGTIILTTHLSSCGPNTINHFYCTDPTPLNVDTFWHVHEANCPVCVCRD